MLEADALFIAVLNNAPSYFLIYKDLKGLERREKIIPRQLKWQGKMSLDKKRIPIFVVFYLKHISTN